ncbi:dTDP-4-dehydrorhamnose 3,5-epimerase [Patiriisocius sp. Uisw_017]|jgi:dTDP-4-dehydrorhamnose 3,5-epimerase|uniref:dTDP-4-dehydrorhamnose 3,5-epimerase n=1 Tax=Patiriisocius sp. Uisw_017 TaxID=3230968 RepID=UPI0039EA17C1
MKFTETFIKGLWIIEPRVIRDDRGYFFESYKQTEFEKHIGSVDFVQENESKSSLGVLRGLHYQKAPFAQSKLVRVLEGKVLDVAVDLRKTSPTFGEHCAIELSEENKKQFFVPRGFAHGFICLSETVVFAYKCDNYYNKESEASIVYNDKDLNIDWHLEKEKMVLSEKDLLGPSFKNAKYFD